MGPANEPPISLPSAMPDPNEITRLLDVKGHNTRSYDSPSISRESTPYVSAGHAEWLERLDYLERSMNKKSFDREEWRQRCIFDERYWQIEADFWESPCMGDNTCYDESFFKDIGQFDWLSPYSYLSAKAKMSYTPHGEVGKLLFGIIYNRQRAKYWQDRCREKGERLDRASIPAIQYWVTEHAFLFQESVRLQKDHCDESPTEDMLARVGAAAKSVGSSKKKCSDAKRDQSFRSQRGRRKTSRAGVVPKGIQKRYNFRDRPASRR